MTKLSIRRFDDRRTGMTVRAVGRPDADTGHQYFTAMSWTADSRRLLVWTRLTEEREGDYYMVDVDTGDARPVAASLPWGRGLVAGDDRVYLYDRHEIWSVSPAGDDRRTVCRLDEQAQFHGPLSIADDCATLGLYWQRQDDWIVGTADAATGEVREAVRPGFAAPYPVADHAMINPVYRELLFYAHEGQTEFIPDRIQLANLSSGEAGCAYPQPRLPSGELGAYVGHEMWSADGEHLYFVRYPHSPLQPTGIYRLPRGGGEAEFVNGDYRYWHVATSPDGRWAVADTQEPGGGTVGKIVLVDLRDGSSRPLCEQARWGHHPGHPHPSFSPDSRQVSFTFADERNRLWVGIIDVEESEQACPDSTASKV